MLELEGASSTWIAELAREFARSRIVILLPRAVWVYFATQPTNLRQSFEVLTNQIRPRSFWPL